MLNECVTSGRSFPSPAFCLPQLAHLEMGRLVLHPEPQAPSQGPVPTVVPRVLSSLGEALPPPAPPPPSPNPKLPADGAVLELFHLAQCAHRPNPLLNDTLLPSTEGGEGADPTRLWFLFPLRQASGSRSLPRCLPGWHQGPLRSLPVPTSDTMCSPFRGSRSFLPEGELEMRALPLVGEESTSPPTIPRLLVFFSWGWNQPRWSCPGFPGPGPHGLALG